MGDTYMYSDQNESSLAIGVTADEETDGDLLNGPLQRLSSALWSLSSSLQASAAHSSAGLLPVRLSCTEVNEVERVLSARPVPLREYDQIPMRAGDLLRQVKLMAPYLQDKYVAFVGDSDCTSLLLGLLIKTGSPGPRGMLVLDFDDRLLSSMSNFAEEHGFSQLLELARYNVFDPLPIDLVGRYDWFYTNPPYGSRNNGESARLFITRGIELCNPEAACGCIIVPDDERRRWSCDAWRATRVFLGEHGWEMWEKVDRAHQYHLDDDRDLTSSTILVARHAQALGQERHMPYAGRRVLDNEIPRFYGRRTQPPYPRYIRRDGSPDNNWTQ
jgi:N4-bis(aminopropyl)spermidine synthase